MNNDKAQPLVGIMLTALSALLITGVLTFAGPCAMHGDGSMGSCYWAARAVLGTGIVLVVIALVRVFERDEGERRGLSFAAACLGVLVACMPGVIIELCTAQTMRCHVVMHPFVIFLGVIIALVGGTDLVLRLRAIFKR